MELKERTVWLIGASSGIGEALVPQLAAACARHPPPVPCAHNRIAVTGVRVSAG